MSRRWDGCRVERSPAAAGVPPSRMLVTFPLRLVCDGRKGTTAVSHLELIRTLPGTLGLTGVLGPLTSVLPPWEG